MGRMSIDKEGSGLPQVDLHRRTTKVNLGTIVGVLLFLVIAALAIGWFIRQQG